MLYEMQKYVMEKELLFIRNVFNSRRHLSAGL